MEELKKCYQELQKMIAEIENRHDTDIMDFINLDDEVKAEYMGDWTAICLISITPLLLCQIAHNPTIGENLCIHVTSVRFKFIQIYRITFSV
ncbi:MAG: hypothetical protein H9W81_12995, partial [Enterococcus sp.]|nr:hypothetical protein [Enterococcus sp.]